MNRFWLKRPGGEIPCIAFASLTDFSNVGKWVLRSGRGKLQNGNLVRVIDDVVAAFLDKNSTTPMFSAAPLVLGRQMFFPEPDFNWIQADAIIGGAQYKIYCYREVFAEELGLRIELFKLHGTHVDEEPDREGVITYNPPNHGPILSPLGAAAPEFVISLQPQTQATQDGSYVQDDEGDGQDTDPP